MGMYDYINSEVICPNCNKETDVSEQIKWSSRVLCHYIIGDYIEGLSNDHLHGEVEIDWGSGVRKELYDICKHCARKIKFAIVLNDGVFTQVKIL